MTSNTAKKVVATVVVAVFSTIGVAAPVDAAPQKTRHVWCC